MSLVAIKNILLCLATCLPNEEPSAISSGYFMETR